MEAVRTILYLINYAGSGGTERYIMRLMEELPSLGAYRFILAYNLDGPLVEWAAQREGVQVVQLAMRHPFDLLSSHRLTGIIKQHGVDIIHTQFLRENFISVWAAWMLGKSHSLKLINTVHMDQPKKGTVAQINNLVSRRLARVITVSKAVADNVRGEGIPLENVELIYHGVLPGPCLEDPIRQQWRREIRQRYGFGDEDFVFVSVGRLSPEKGHRFLLESFHKGFPTNEQVKLMVIGDGEVSAELRRIAGELGLDKRIIFTGYQREVPQFLAASDVFVLPSLTEALSFSLLEAMAAGLPCIGAKVGGVPEVLDESFGIFCQPGDVDSLTSAMQFMTQNKSKLAEQGKYARALLENKFSLHAMVRKTHDLYGNVMKKK